MIGKLFHFPSEMGNANAVLENFISTYKKKTFFFSYNVRKWEMKMKFWKWTNFISIKKIVFFVYNVQEMGNENEKMRFHVFWIEFDGSLH